VCNFVHCGAVAFHLISRGGLSSCYYFHITFLMLLPKNYNNAFEFSKVTRQNIVESFICMFNVMVTASFLMTSQLYQHCSDMIIFGINFWIRK